MTPSMTQWARVKTMLTRKPEPKPTRKAPPPTVLLRIWKTISTPIIAADQNKGPESISEAWNLASSDLGNIFVILLVAGLLSIFTCGIGAPIGYIALAYVYKQKRGEPIAA